MDRAGSTPLIKELFAARRFKLAEEEKAQRLAEESATKIAPDQASAATMLLTARSKRKRDVADHIWSNAQAAWEHFFGSDVSETQCPTCGGVMERFCCATSETGECDGKSGTSGSDGISQTSDSDYESETTLPSGSTDWHIAHIVSDKTGGPKDVYNCIPVCADCILSCNNKNLLQWLSDGQHSDKLLPVVKLLDRAHQGWMPAGANATTLAQIVYHNYRPANGDFNAKFYAYLGQEPSVNGSIMKRLFQRISELENEVKTMEATKHKLEQRVEVLESGERSRGELQDLHEGESTAEAKAHSVVETTGLKRKSGDLDEAPRSKKSVPMTGAPSTHLRTQFRLTRLQARCSSPSRL